jgi:hypothetical protein
MDTGTTVRAQSLRSRTTTTLRIIRTGSSGATVRIIQQADGRLLAVKTARNPRITAQQQAAARNIIAPYFGDRLPGVLFAGRHQDLELLITDCPSESTLADAVAAGSPAALPAWADFVSALHGVWTRSAQPGFDPARATRRHQLRWERGVDGLQFAIEHMGLSTAGREHLIVNGTDHGALDSVLDRLAHIPPPAMHVACQGDPQPRNVLLDPESRWHLVDWEWAGLHQDWRMMTSHLAGWWYVEQLLHSAHGTTRPTTPGVIRLSYESPPRHAPALPLTPAARIFHQMTSPERADQDLIALMRHTAMLLLREIPQALSRGHRHLFAPLLGEAIRLTTTEPHPLFESFTQPGRDETGRT